MRAADARQFVLDFFKELAGGNEACWDRVAEDADWKLIARASDYPYPSDYSKASYRRLVADSVHEFPTGLRFTITGTTAEDDRVARSGILRNDASWKLYNNLYHLPVPVENDKIRTVREYLDSACVTEVLGRTVK